MLPLASYRGLKIKQCYSLERPKNTFVVLISIQMSENFKMNQRKNRTYIPKS